MSDHSHDDDKTPVSTEAGSEEAATIKRLLDRLREVERDLRPLASVLSQIAKSDRRAFYKRLSNELRDIGHLAHDSARTVEAFLRK